MKISWGTGLAIFISVFLLVTIGLVLYMMTIDVNLVADNYYEQEIKYQTQIDKIKRTSRLPEQVNLKVKGNVVNVVFPKLFSNDVIEGDVLLFRPSNNNFDISTPIKIDSSYILTIKHPQLVEGLWKAKINWSVGDSTYYNEEIVIIN